MLKAVVSLTAFCAVTHSIDTPGADAQSFPPNQVKRGAAIYEQNCSACHGPRMADPQGAFDLRAFPPDEHARFVSSVSKGKNAMPPWGDLLKPDDIESLWAYVMAGEAK
jgi:mono/diheme cytochrome c family protein